MEDKQGPLEEPAGAWFVNRNEEIYSGNGRPVFPIQDDVSYALIGLRRPGKTAILHKLFNRLFNEQEQVVPIYISFARHLHRTKPIDAFQFAEEYILGYICSYLAFRYRQPSLFRQPLAYEDLFEFAQQVSDELMLDLFHRYQRTRSAENSSIYNLFHWAIEVPRGLGFEHQIPSALIIDEFQVLTRVHNPDNRKFNKFFSICLREPLDPMLVSGLSISMLVGEALGGMLSGRFQPWYLDPLSQEHAIDMVFRTGQINGIDVTQALPLAIGELTQDYPYPIDYRMPDE